MFDALSDRFDGIFKRLRGKGRLSDSDVDEVLREIRVALLEADVNLTVVRTVVARIREQSVGADLSQEPRARRSRSSRSSTRSSSPPSAARRSGSPTPRSRRPSCSWRVCRARARRPASAKLARWFKAQGRNPLLVGADLQRPAAVEQLRTLGRQIDVPVFSEPSDPVTVAGGGVAEARRLGRDVVIVDTAGRLAIDGEMMEQVRQISATVQPDYTFLVVDAMTGQDAVTVAEAFHETLAIDGVILSKLDGDARGGAALSVKEVIGQPIAFASTGEKLDDFEQFHPDRMASRILGMGDVLTPHREGRRGLREGRGRGRCGQAARGRVHARRLPRADAAAQEDGAALECDRYDPGACRRKPKNAKIDDDQLKRVEAIIRSMTLEERRKPELIERRRDGCASPTAAARRPRRSIALVKQFKDMQKMMKRMGGLGSKKGKRRMPMMPNVPSLN